MSFSSIETLAIEQLDLAFICALYRRIFPINVDGRCMALPQEPAKQATLCALEWPLGDHPRATD